MKNLALIKSDNHLKFVYGFMFWGIEIKHWFNQTNNISMLY